MLEVNELTKEFVTSRGLLGGIIGDPETLVAVDGVSFNVEDGESFGLAGESGCGKTTTGKIIAKLHEPTSGEIIFKGRNVANLKGEELKQYRKDAQMIFQDPYESLNPRLTVFGLIKEGLDALDFSLTREKKKEKIFRSLNQVKLSPGEYKSKLPFELSGGERQRVMIASAIVLEPEFIVADEPVSMLDVSIRAGIIELIEEEITESLGLTRLYISHDLSILSHVVDRIGIMYLGRLVEVGDGREVLTDPVHPYSKALVSAIPVPDPNFSHEDIKIEGTVSSSSVDREGCVFLPRCPYSIGQCGNTQPKLIELAESNSVNHLVACHRYPDRPDE